MNEEYKRVVDRINHSTNEKLRTLHDECVREMINYMRSHSSASSHDIENQLNYITQKYNQGVRSAIQAAQDEYRNYISRYISQISGGLKRELNINYNTTGISISKENLIKESTDEFKESLSKYVSGSIRKNNALSIQEEVNAFHGIGADASNVKSSSLQGIEKLCNLLTRASTTEGYMTISSLIGDIPEVMGYEIAVTPTDKHGHSRVVDICDHMKGEYPKEFKFKGWHPNCRCIISPIIPDDMMTPALKAAGFIGRPRGSKITPPREALEYVKENRDKNPQLFDKFDAYREVEFRGQKQFYMEMSPTSRLSFNIEEISNITGKYLDKLHRVDIKINDDMDEGVLMSTVPKDGSYQIEMRSSQAEILSQGLSKRGLKLPLTPQQVEVTADELHELTHTLSLDYTFGESLDINVNKPLAALLEKEKKLDPSKMSPEEYEKEKEKIRKKRAKIEQTRNTIIDFHHGFRPLEVETLETLVEWSMRENYASVMEQIGITLPADYASYINRGYNNSVTNFNALVNRIPVKNVEAFRNDIDKILSNPDKAFTSQRLADAIKRSGVLNKGTRNKDLLMFMHTMPTEEFEVNLDYLAVPKDKSLPASPTANAAVGSRASTTPPTTPIDIHNSGVTSKTIKNITRGTLAAGAISLTAGAAGSVIDPEREEQEVKYIPEILYKGNYTRSLMAGVIDRALNSVEDASYIFKDAAVFQFYSMYLPFSSKTREMKQNLKSSMGDMGEFMMMLATDGEFRGQIWEIIKTEFSEYIDSIAGFSPEHGYAQGQLIFDIVSLFIGVGEVKATLASFKNTKSVLRIKKEIKKTKVLIKKWLDKKLPKTEKPKALHAPAETPPTPKAPPAKETEIKTIKKLPSGAELIKENNSISLNTGYIQNEKAVKHNFTTYGKKLRGKGYLNFKNKISDIVVERKYIKEMYMSGSTLPKVINVTEGMELYKIVPKNSIVHDQTPYWITKTELIKIFNNEKRIEDMLSLPEGSCKGIYDIYKITLKKDQDIKNIRIFESKIAPSRQGTIKRKGGAKQILVPDRNIWTDAVKIEEFKIE